MAYGNAVPNELRWSLYVTHENGVGFNIDTGITAYPEVDGDEALNDLAAYLAAWSKRNPNNAVYGTKLIRLGSEWQPDE